MTEEGVSADGRSWHDLRQVFGNTLGLAVAMGVGRFAYTPLLPVMQAQLGFSASFAGLLASFNYAGYLIGAVSAAWLPERSWAGRQRTVVWSLVGSVLTTAAMGWTTSRWIWEALRALGGLFSAWVLVLSSSLVMRRSTPERHEPGVGMLFAGVGTGIVLTGVLVPVFTRRDGWSAGWVGLGAVSLLLVAVAVWLTSGRAAESAAGWVGSQAAAPEDPAFRLWGITAAYGLEGVGYIVMATFITVFFHSLSATPWLGDAGWVLVGAAAVPSTWLWAAAARGWGWRRATYTAFAAQAAGVLLPTAIPGVAPALAGSLLFGGTFMGITTLSLSIGRQCAPAESKRVIGRMTAMFGIGQVLGPLAAGGLASATDTYLLPMRLSGMLLLAAVGLLWLARGIPGGMPPRAMTCQGFGGPCPRRCADCSPTTSRRV